MSIEKFTFKQIRTLHSNNNHPCININNSLNDEEFEEEFNASQTEHEHCDSCLQYVWKADCEEFICIACKEKD
jgi:hypothetical protein